LTLPHGKLQSEQDDLKGITMIRMHVPDMTCGGCAAAITRALQAADAQAQVQIDLPSHQVSVQSRLGADQVLGALKMAGFSPALQAA
jgi:copper chaperone